MRTRIIALLAIVGLPAFAYAQDYQLSLEPSPPVTGAELFLQLSSSLVGSCWVGPLPVLSSEQLDPDALRLYLTGADYGECLAQPLDAQYSLGVVPTGVTHVEIFACVDQPIPGYPACSSDPFFVVAVDQMLFKSTFE